MSMMFEESPIEENDEWDEVLEDLPILYRLRKYLEYDTDVCLPYQYSPHNMFEQSLFVSIWLIKFWVEIIVRFVLLILCPIWGPIYLIVKVVKERRKNEGTPDSK